MLEALLAGVTNPDVVAVSARRHQDSQRVVPGLEADQIACATTIPAIAWERPTPSLAIYDTLLPEQD
jgi:hypothetical protein